MATFNNITEMTSHQTKKLLLLHLNENLVSQPKWTKLKFLKHSLQLFYVFSPFFCTMNLLYNSSLMIHFVIFKLCTKMVNRVPTYAYKLIINNLKPLF